MLRVPKSKGDGRPNGTHLTNHHHDNETTPSPELVNHRERGMEEEEEEDESGEVPLGIDDTMFVSEVPSPQQRSSVVSLGSGGGGEELGSKRESTISMEGSSGLVAVR